MKQKRTPYYSPTKATVTRIHPEYNPPPPQPRRWLLRRPYEPWGDWAHETVIEAEHYHEALAIAVFRYGAAVGRFGITLKMIKPDEEPPT